MAEREHARTSLLILGIIVLLSGFFAQHRLSASAHIPTKEKRASRIPAEDSLSAPYPLTQSKGLNKPVLVGMTGFEPATP